MYRKSSKKSVKTVSQTKQTVFIEKIIREINQRHRSNAVKPIFTDKHKTQ